MHKHKASLKDRAEVMLDGANDILSKVGEVEQNVALCAEEAGVEEAFLNVAAHRAFWNWKKSVLAKVAVTHGVTLLDKNNISQIVLDFVKLRVGEHWSDEQLFSTFSLRSGCYNTARHELEKFDPAMDLLDSQGAKAANQHLSDVQTKDELHQQFRRDVNSAWSCPSAPGSLAESTSNHLLYGSHGRLERQRVCDFYFT